MGGAAGGDEKPREFEELIRTLHTIHATHAGSDPHAGLLLTLMGSKEEVRDRVQREHMFVTGSGMEIRADGRVGEWVPAKIRRSLQCVVVCLDDMGHFELQRFWKTAESDLEEASESHLIPDLRELCTRTQALPPALWSMGYRISSANLDQVHELMKLKIGIYIWCALSREAKRTNVDAETLWREARENGLSNLRSWKKNTGGKSDSTTGSATLTISHPVKGALLDATDCGDDPYWVKMGIVDSSDTYFEMFKDANRKDNCKNCGQAGHSIAWCNAERKKDLLCQLCLCGAHAERLCDGSDMAIPGNSPPPLMWKANVCMWLGRISGYGVRGRGGGASGGGAPGCDGG
mmetsp:Transcript_62463/g.129733  ORF Transcript_62463/g.129733 Transcript_62463/m.129733 type:complete len:348 (-) Transcript_62463:3683-4726(-)